MTEHQDKTVARAERVADVIVLKEERDMLLEDLPDHPTIEEHIEEFRRVLNDFARRLHNLEKKTLRDDG